MANLPAPEGAVERPVSMREIFTALIEGGFDGPMRARVATADRFIPLGPAAEHVLVQEADIERAAVELVRGGPGPHLDPHTEGRRHA